MRRGALHSTRPRVTRHQPVHVSLPIEKVVGRMRTRAGYRAVRRGIAVCMGRVDMRIVQASIQANHVHLLVEADDERALSRGLRAFMTACARSINAQRARTGRVFAGRYCMTLVTSPRQARNTLAYVINNWRRHRDDRGATATRIAAIDPYSSGARFDGWADAPERSEMPAGYEPLPVKGACSWLLTIGWRRYPQIRVREVPGPEPR